MPNPHQITDHGVYDVVEHAGKVYVLYPRSLRVWDFNTMVYLGGPHHTAGYTLQGWVTPDAAFAIMPISDPPDRYGTELTMWHIKESLENINAPYVPGAQADGRVTSSIDAGTHKYPIGVLALSPDGKMLVTSQRNPEYTRPDGCNCGGFGMSQCCMDANVYDKQIRVWRYGKRPTTSTTTTTTTATATTTTTTTTTTTITSITTITANTSTGTLLLAPVTTTQGKGNLPLLLLLR